MINYRRLAESQDYYNDLGYQRIEAPWMVSEEIMNLTKPPGSTGYHVKEVEKVLVASAEQSFLYMANKGHLPKGSYQATTPCFRFEPIDLLHRKTFIKNELINTKSTTISDLEKMTDEALAFFSKYVDKNKLSIIEVPAHMSIINYDIIAKVQDAELELGSYGIRHCEILKWVYGTGCAEPRLSLIMNRIELGL